MSPGELLALHLLRVARLGVAPISMRLPASICETPKASLARSAGPRAREIKRCTARPAEDGDEALEVVIAHAEVAARSTRTPAEAAGS